MKDHVKILIENALRTLNIDALSQNIEIDIPKNRELGHFSCNIAMKLAKAHRMPPLELAKKIVAALPNSGSIKKVEIAGPGFINFYLHDEIIRAIVCQIFNQGEQFGKIAAVSSSKFLLEFVSANPTGPLHVGHGRGAAFGASLANVLKWRGHQVFTEYYVNDAGRQMHILAVSCFLRYLELLGVKFPFPKNAYQGEYVLEISQMILSKHQDQFKIDISMLYHDVPEDLNEEGTSGDKEAHIDGLIKNAKTLLKDNYDIFFQAMLTHILADIKDDLQEFGVTFDTWFSEASLIQDQAVKRALDCLTDKGFTYQKEGALWFKSSEFGDEKDRVVIRENGEYTYFASDIAYHFKKLERGFEKIIDVFGADHHGYVPRIKASMEALTGDSQHFQALLVQFAILYRGKERVQMSTRSGSFVTLRSLRHEVGNDAARFFYVMRKCDQHMDFDLDLAKSQSQENPVYYIQYAHARIQSVLSQSGLSLEILQQSCNVEALQVLSDPTEQNLIYKLHLFEEILSLSAKSLEVHSLAFYLQELAGDFHHYYNAHQFLVSDEALKISRLCLIAAIGQVLRVGLKLLGVSAPSKM